MDRHDGTLVCNITNVVKLFWPREDDVEELLLGQREEVTLGDGAARADARHVEDDRDFSKDGALAEHRDVGDVVLGVLSLGNKGAGAAERGQARLGGRTFLIQHHGDLTFRNDVHLQPHFVLAADDLSTGDELCSETVDELVHECVGGGLEDRDGDHHVPAEEPSQHQLQRGRKVGKDGVVIHEAVPLPLVVEVPHGHLLGVLRDFFML
mmetsp:Transcript_38045/g.52833  ORF Transcript_38045/g.52833 Transcript_38045/m.52833 type:complete len:209 (+) Transcript_38045:1940-2566(+)